MLWLLLSIVCSTLIVLIFKSFGRFNISTLQAIIVNYFICTTLSFVGAEESESFSGFLSAGWLPFAIFLGSLFIALFLLIGETTQKSGVTVTSLAMKLALVAPVILGVVVYGESFTINKGIGVALALVAVVLSSIKPKRKSGDHSNANKWVVLLPILVFIGSCVSDSVVQYIEIKFFQSGGFESFLGYLFLTAASLGLMILIVRILIGKETLQWRNVLAGIILGIPNYGSIFFLFKTLNLPNWESSVIFPLNNIGIVSLSAVAAFIIFRERLSVVNWYGLLFAILAILLMAVEV